MKKKWQICLFAAIAVVFCGAATAGETSSFLKNRHAKSVKTITLDGMWYWNFASCKAYAEKHGVPLIAVWSNGDACSHCTKFENACSSAVFKNWMKTSGCVFYFTYPGDGGEGKLESSTFNWIRQQQTSFPFIRIYWSVNGKKKVDVSTIGDTVDNYERGTAGGKAAVAYFKKILKNYKYVPAPVVPKYTGGVFDCGDTESDHLEAEIGSTTFVNVPIARTNTTAQVVASTNTLEIVYPDESVVSKTIYWAARESETNITVDIPTTLASTDVPIKLVLLNAAGAGVETNHITLVKDVENAPSNPLWIGEKTADELEWGEWTMDLDVAMAKVAAYNAGTGETTSGSGGPTLLGASEKDRAYTLVLLEGSLWCPDCKKTDMYLLEKPAFIEWARDNKVALVAIDLPYGDKSATAPTLLTYDMRFGASGASYLSRKMIDADQAAEILARNFEIAQKLRLPNWSNATRPPVPSLFILRDDGTIAARNQYFGGVESPTSDANLEAHLLRLDEMLLQVDMEEESSNDNRYWTTETIGIRERIEGKTLSFSDSADVYRLDPAKTAGKRMTFTLSGDDRVELQLQLIQATGSSSTVLAKESGYISEGVTLGAAIPSTNCYISVDYVTNGSVPTDARFSVANTVSSLCEYALASDFVVEPTELAKDNQVALVDGVNEVNVNLVSNQLYRITNIDTANAGNLEALEPATGTVEDLYLSLVDGDFRLALTDSTTSIQKWNPGTVGFVAQRASVAESAGAYQIRVARTGGASGRATAQLSFLRAQYPDLVDLGEFPADPLVWEEGETDVREAKVLLVENTFADGDQAVVFGADAGGDAESGITEFTLVVRDNDKVAPGRIAIDATTPAMAKPMTVFARRGGSVTLSLRRFDGAAGIQEVELASDAGTLDAEELSWENRDTAAQDVNLTLPASGNAVKVTLTPKKGSAIDASRRTLTVNLLDASVPGFAVDAKTVDATRYIPVAADSIAVDGTATGVKLYSGALPSGVKWAFSDGQLQFSGIPSKAGSFTAAFRAYNGSTAGLTTVVTFNVGDPVVDAVAPDSAEPVNAAVAKSVTIPDITVLRADTNLVAGVLTLTLPRNGRASAKMTCLEYGKVSFSSASWDGFAEDGRTLKATLRGKAGDADLELNASVAPDGTVSLELAGYTFVLPDTKWSKDNPATDFKGYYTAAMPFDGTLSGNTPARGTGGLTLKMNTASAINAGKVTFAGFYPSGKSFSGSAVLSAKDWGGDAQPFWRRAVLPVVLVAAEDSLAAALQLTPGAWDVTATNSVENGMCAGRCSYKAIRRSVRTLDEAPTALWRHNDKAAAVSGEIALDVLGTYYNSAENFVSCCQASHGTPNLTFFVLDGVNASAATDDFALNDVDLTKFATNKAAIAVTYAKATKNAKKKTSQIAKTAKATALSSFSFTLSTGLVSGSFKVDGVTFTYQGVVMPGWGSQDCTSCGYSVDVDGGAEAPFSPFITGSAWFNDTIEYVDAHGKTRTATVRRSTPFSVGVNPGE